MIFGTGRRRENFDHWSLARTNAQSRSQPESPRARVPDMAGFELSPATVMRAAMHQCGVVGDAELAVQLHRRCTFLVLGHEVDALEPHRQGQLGGLEDGAGGNGGLAVAAIALLELVCGQLAASVVAAVRAHEAVGPAPSVEGVEALFFGAVEGEELVEADSFLEAQAFPHRLRQRPNDIGVSRAQPRQDTSGSNH